jgi:hypothetical protein
VTKSARTLVWRGIFAVGTVVAVFYALGAPYPNAG